ncbi:Bestrophin, RFP-TM, chloride channel-domain-containing protein, partial [Chytriomyces cf. hyalinus JEL632]
MSEFIASSTSITSTDSSTACDNSLKARNQPSRHMWCTGGASLTTILSLSFSFTQPTSLLDARKAANRRLDNIFTFNWADLLDFNLSIAPCIVLPSLGITLCSVLVCWVFLLNPEELSSLPSNATYITVVIITINLLTTFRTVNAYDRFWEGRKLWSQVSSSVLNLARFMAVYDKTKNPIEAEKKRNALLLLRQFPSAVKDVVRTESEDLFNTYQPILNTVTTQTPVQLVQSFQDYTLSRPFSRKPFAHIYTAWISTLIRHLCHLERIQTTPLPIAYRIHLRQISICYLCGIPFSIVTSCRWLTIPITAICSLLFLGILAIADEIEQPFGMDARDLPLEDFCGEIEKGVDYIMNRMSDCEGGDELGWIRPAKMVRVVEDDV